MFLETKTIHHLRNNHNLRVSMLMKVLNQLKINLMLLQIFRLDDLLDIELLHLKKFLFVKPVTVTESLLEIVKKQLHNKVRELRIKTKILLSCNSLKTSWCKQKWSIHPKLPPTKSGKWKRKNETIHQKSEDNKEKKLSKPTDLPQKMKWCFLVMFF